MMKSFLYKITVFILFLLISCFFVLSQADGYTDAFYLRFTSPKQNSLIIGTSRAAQGIQPKYLNKFFPNLSFYNYSFTIAHSPYGPTYLESIKKKINEDTKNGIFVLEVNPWSISSLCKDPNDLSNFRELTLCLANTYLVNINPNIVYLMRNYDKPYYNLLRRDQSSMFLHNNGWLEVTIDMDSTAIKIRSENKINEYLTNYLPFFKFSELRLEYLSKTIEFLKQHGDVFLIRLPVHPKMRNIDQQMIADFDDKMVDLAFKLNISYNNMSELNSEYIFTDANHLYKKSAYDLTIKLAKWILNQRKQENNKLSANRKK